VRSCRPLRNAPAYAVLISFTVCCSARAGNLTAASNGQVIVNNASGCDSNQYACLNVNNKTGLDVTNNGSLNTRVHGIAGGGSISNLLNTGSIKSAGGWVNGHTGINGVSGGITILKNYGTIFGAHYVRSALDIAGSPVATLYNSQGAGAVGKHAWLSIDAQPTNYFVRVDSTSKYGRLVVGSANSSSMNFDIDPLSLVQAGFTYSSVLTGSLSGLFNTSGTYSGKPWSLSLQSGSTNVWDLVFASLGISPGSSYYASTTTETVFAGGVLQVDAHGTYTTSYGTGTAGSIQANGLRSVFSGVFSGTGSLSLLNSTPGGFIGLSALNTYTGATDVAAGVNLVVNGSIASSSLLSVASGGAVSGTGFLPQTNLVAGARLAPGNSIGTITVAALNLNGGTIDAEIQGPQNDRIDVTGQVTNFTGTANLIPYDGGSPWPNFTYTIVSAPNSADFATSTSLTLDQSGVTSALLRSGTTLIQNADGNPKTFDVQWQPRNGFGATASAMQALGQGYSNQLATSGAVDRVFRSLATNAANNANNTGTLIGSTGFTTGQASEAGISSGFLSATSQLLSLTSNSQLIAAINSLSPVPYAAYQAVGLSTLKRQRDLLFSQAGNCQSNGWIINAPENKKGKRPKRPVCVFAQANNATSSIRGQDGLSSYNSGVFSSFYGLEYQPSKQWSVGAAYGYGTSNLSNMSLTSANVSSDVNGGALYAVYKPAERWNIKALLGYSNFDVDGSRNVAYIGNGSTINGNTSANGYTAAINASYDIPIKVGKGKLPMLLKPIAGLAWGGYQQSGFTESDGGALNLRVNGNTANSLVGTLGMEFASSPIALSKNKVQSITPRLAVAYQVDALANSSGNKSLTSSFVDAPGAGSFSTQGENGGANAFTVAGGFDLQVAKNASLYATVSYEVESNGSQFGYGGGLRVSF
jgi:uncharacterized protein with beta-barrel porin domain